MCEYIYVHIMYRLYAGVRSTIARVYDITDLYYICKLCLITSLENKDLKSARDNV